MKWIKLITVCLLLTRIVYTDVTKGKIENICIRAGMTAGLLLAYGSGGVGEVWMGIKMSAVLLLALFFLFVIKGLGAGDIKLLCMLAVFYPKQIISIVILSFFAGAFWAVGKMIIRWFRKMPFYIRKEALHFSVPVAVSTLLVVGMAM